MPLTQVGRGGLSADAIDASKLADNSIDSEHIVDGSVDHAHLSADCVDGDNIADGSIAHAHLSDDCVDGDNIAADVALTGNPTATTQSSGNDSTRIATTAFVQAAVGSLSSNSITNGNSNVTVANNAETRITVNSVDAATFGTGGVVFNEDSANRDFRVESDDSTHMLFIDSGNDRVGINNADPGAPLDVEGDIRLSDSSNNTISRIFLDGSTVFNEQGAAVDFRVESDDNANMLFVDGDQDRVGIGTNAPEYTLDVNGTDAVALPAGNDGARPGSLDANDHGVLRFNSTSGRFEYWSSTSTTAQWRNINQDPLRVISVEYLVIGGGGAGGTNIGGAWHYDSGGGGGAGGYRTNFGSGNISGGLSAVESALELNLDTAYTVTVGAGGVASTAGRNNGGDSVLASITSTGGGCGGFAAANNSTATAAGANGGSGGGGGHNSGSPGSGTTGQGFAGGDENSTQTGGGGGGAGEVGDNSQPCEGGDGIASSITGSSVTRAGGGGAGAGNGQSAGAGGAGGGGAGGTSLNGQGNDGTANTGGGGGGCGARSGAGNLLGGDGGSGVVIIRIPNTCSATFGSGVTASAASAVGSDRVYTVTAGSGTVTFSLD